jgi:ACS family tartrate transporter-like MFS transporter
MLMLKTFKKTTDRSELASINERNAWKIIPILLLGYLLNTIDKTNIGFASLEMNKALGFTPAVFGLGAGLFFVSYAFLELPSNLLMRRFGARKWLSRILISWGLIAMAMASIHNETSFYITRLLLGVAEAGWFPGVLFYLSLWFPGYFRARAITLFFLGVPIAAMIGGPVSGALLTLPTIAGVANWQWLFIVEGLPTVILGFLILVVLKDKPADATWLTRRGEGTTRGDH